jgi:hypothetical protein
MFLVVALAWVLVPVGVRAAAPGLVRLVDGNGSSKVEVDRGKVRVGDGSGALSVDGTVAVKKATPGVLLRTGSCGPGATETTLPVGSVVTSIFVTGVPGQYPGSRLDIFPGSDDTGFPLMSLKVYFGASGEGDTNAIYSSDNGFKVTGAAPWTVVCGGIISSSGTNGGLYSIFGHAA